MASAKTSTPLAAIEQRVFYRLTIELPLRYRLVTRSRAPRVFENGSCLNLSAGGMLVRVRALDEATGDELLAADGRVELEFVLPGVEAPLRVSARPLWMENDGDATRVGVQFLDLPAAAQEQVQQFVLRHSLG